MQRRAGCIQVQVTPTSRVAAHGAERYFDGTDWTQRWRPAPLPLLTVEERTERLDAAIAEMLRDGGRVVFRSDTQAVIVVAGMPPRWHVLHFVMTVLTCGLWVVIWLLSMVVERRKRRTVSVDEYGNVVVEGPGFWRW